MLSMTLTAVETITLSQAFQRGMSEEMARDDTIFVIGTDLYERGGHFAQVKGLGPTFGVDRVRDAPISRGGNGRGRRRGRAQTA